MKISTEKLSQLLGYRQFFTSTELVKYGIFGSRAAVWIAVKKGLIEAIYITERRRVILKESLIEHIRKQNG